MGDGQVFTAGLIRAAFATVFATALTLTAAGGHPASAQTAPAASARKAITVMASPLQIRFTKAVSEHLTAKFGLPPLEVSSVLAAQAVKSFCSGVSAETPDIIALPRRLAKREYEKCAENGVIDIIELPVGFDALVLVVRKGDRVFNMTPRAMYFALAAEIPAEDEFVRNDARRWSDLDSRLPNIDINVVASENGTSINAFFKEIFMEGGCRGLRQFKVYYSSVDRVKTCTTLREDGRFIGVPAPISTNFRDVFRRAPAGAIGIVPYTVYQHNSDWLELMPLQGVKPSNASIRDDSYEAVSPVRFYVKRRHMERSLGGDGIVPGLYNFIEEIMSEEALGENGYLPGLGLVADDPDDRDRDRDAALRLTPFRR